MSEGNDTSVPMLHIEKKVGALPDGASGCPIMIHRGNKLQLAGLYFCGDDDDEDGKGYALQWTKGIQDYIQKGVGIIAGTGSYMAYSSLASKLSKRMQEMQANREMQAKLVAEASQKLEEMQPNPEMRAILVAEASRKLEEMQANLKIQETHVADAYGQAQKSREDLETDAREGKLTIYLTNANGDIIGNQKKKEKGKGC